MSVQNPILQQAAAKLEASELEPVIPHRSAPYARSIFCTQVVGHLFEILDRGQLISN
jgi:hypothetical protein